MKILIIKLNLLQSWRDHGFKEVYKLDSMIYEYTERVFSRGAILINDLDNIFNQIKDMEDCRADDVEDHKISVERLIEITMNQIEYIGMNMPFTIHIEKGGQLNE